MDNLPLTVKMKWKMLLFFSLFIVIVGLIAVVVFPSQSQPVFAGLALIVIGLLTLPLSIGAARTELLYIDHQGLTFRRNRKSAVGPVPWGEITDIRLEEHSSGRTSQNFIIFDVADNQKYFKKPKSQERMAP